jgi:hypothetical protein
VAITNEAYTRRAEPFRRVGGHTGLIITGWTTGVLLLVGARILSSSPSPDWYWGPLSRVPWTIFPSVTQSVFSEFEMTLTSIES